MLSVTMTK